MTATWPTADPAHEDAAAAFRQLADEHLDAGYGRAGAIDPRHGLRRRAAPLDEESQLAGG